jgi:DNA-binding NarL/FixJ family response regulator
MRGPGAGGHTRRMPLRCIIVDDYQPFVKVARVNLERQGMAVAGVAATGGEAVRLARALRPDVALVDISLGAESGFDVARLISGYAGSVILISSDDHDEDDGYGELIAASAAAGFLSKAALSADAIRRLVS